MKKYKLKIKDDNAKWNNYGVKIHHDIGDGYVWLINGIIGIYSYNLKEGFTDVFTEEDINKLPYGFVKQHELIEVEEELYNIVCPYTNQIFIMCEINGNTVWSADKNSLSTVTYKRQFTLKEIKDKYPMLLNWAKSSKNI